MNTCCPNCGKVAGLHSSILQGCMCQYSVQAPPQRTWVGLTDEEIIDVLHPLVMADMSDEVTDYEIARAIEAILKEKNT